MRRSFGDAQVPVSPSNATDVKTFSIYPVTVIPGYVAMTQKLTTTRQLSFVGSTVDWYKNQSTPIQVGVVAGGVAVVGGLLYMILK